MNSIDYVVIEDNLKHKINDAECHNIDEFFEQASESLDIQGDLYCHLPCFDEQKYNILMEVAESTIWFVFNKDEIPSWFDSSKAVIIGDPNENDEDDFNEEPTAMAKEQMTPTTKEDPFASPVSQGFSSQESEPTMTFDNFKSVDEELMNGVQNILTDEIKPTDNNGNKEATIYVFGSSKGGTGKTFTCLISARRYAKMHPSEKVAVVDFDIIDGQVGISIHMTRPTLMDFYRQWANDIRDFKTMDEASRVKSEHFPPNLDFFLAPKDYYIANDSFWVNVLENLINNYDTVFFDTGIDYINYAPISYVYKIADRIVLVSTTSIKSVSSVLKQINKLAGTQVSTDAKGEQVFNASDGIKPKLRLAITGTDEKDSQNAMILDTFRNQIPINAIFGQLSQKINRAEYYGEWNVFDNNQKFNESLDNLVDLNK